MTTTIDEVIALGDGQTIDVLNSCNGVYDEKKIPWKYIRNEQGIISAVVFDCPLGDMYGSLIMKRFQISPIMREDDGLQFIEWFSDNGKYKFLMANKKIICHMSQRIEGIDLSTLEDQSEGYDIIDFY